MRQCGLRARTEGIGPMGRGGETNGSGRLFHIGIVYDRKDFKFVWIIGGAKWNGRPRYLAEPVV